MVIDIFGCYEDFEKFMKNRIAMLRTMNEISARDMSLSLGLNESYINHIETGNNMPSMKNFYNICEQLNMEPKDFFDDGVELSPLEAEVIHKIKRLDNDKLKIVLDVINSMKK